MQKILFFGLLCCLYFHPCSAQDSPCHCLYFGLEFHEGAENFDFVVDSIFKNQKGETVHLYRERTYGRIIALATVKSLPKNSSPKVELTQLNQLGSYGITLKTYWDYDFDKAEQRRQAFAKRKGKVAVRLPIFDFLPPMNNKIEVDLQFFPVYAVWPLSKEDVKMGVKLQIAAHPFYSDRNPKSPFHTRAPDLRIKLTYIEGYDWTVTLKDGTTLQKQLKKRSS